MKLVADSALQLESDAVHKLGITVVEYPLYVNDEPYPVSMEMSREEKDTLRLILKDKNNKVTTSGLRKEDLLATYRKFPGEKIISLHQSGRASMATMAVIHEILAEESSLDIEFVDAHHLTAAYSVVVQQVAEAVQQGLPIEEIRTLIEYIRPHTRHLGAVYDLFYLHRTGRIGLAKAVLGTALKITALLSSSDEPGMLVSIGKAKNHLQGNQRLISIIREDLERLNGTRLRAVISVIGPHEKEAEHLKSSVEQLECETHVEIHYTNHSNMPHAGPDFYDIGYTIYTD